MEENQYTLLVQKALEEAGQQAEHFHHPAVGTAHLLLGLYLQKDSVAYAVLSRAIPNGYDRLREEVEYEIGYGASQGPYDQNHNILYTLRTKRILQIAKMVAVSMKSPLIGTEHVLIALLSKGNIVTRLLKNLDVDVERMRKDIYATVGQREPFRKPWVRDQQDQAESQTPTLDELAKDLTEQARQHNLDPVIGRNKEVHRLTQILSRRKKNNPVLVGEPGVGKTAIVEAIAERIADGNVSDALANKRIMSLDVGSMVAGTKYRGEFEDRMKKLINEIEEDGHVILFIDELHTVIGAGGAEGAVDASNLLKPALARGRVQVIGATTSNEYQKYIERDGALARRFARVLVEEPSYDETVQILDGLKPTYQKFHRVRITDEAIEAIVRLSTRYLTDRYLPDKAIDVMDEAAATLRLEQGVTKASKAQVDDLEEKWVELETQKNFLLRQRRFEEAAELQRQQKAIEQKQNDSQTEEMDEIDGEKTWPVLTEKEVADVLAEWTGIPSNRMSISENKRLVHLEEILHRRVKGQDEAVHIVAQTIKRSRSGLRDLNRPMGSLIFLGPTGVGKTELAKALAEAVFGTEDAMIRLDMSEYMERYSSSRLIGSAPGYVGYEEGGQLTEKVRQHPYSVVLFDEIEKAHPDVYDMLLQILDDGYITDSKGRKVDFRNTVLILTSNIGARELQDNKRVGFGQEGDDQAKQDYKQMKSAILDEMKKHFRPEFLNRIDEQIVFHTLQESEMEAIVKKFTDQMRERLEESDKDLRFTAAAIRLIAKESYQPEMGARPVRRYLQQHVESPLSDLLLEGQIQDGDVIQVGAQKGKLYFRLKHDNGTQEDKSMAQLEESMD